MSTLPCISCGKQLEPAFRNHDGGEVPGWLNHNQPYAGTMFTSYGNYGSTVYDPSPGISSREYLEVNICDECLLAKAGSVLLIRTEPRPEHTEEPWDAEGLAWCAQCGRAVLPEEHDQHDR